LEKFNHASPPHGLPGHRRNEVTPFFERLCPAMTMERNDGRKNGRKKKGKRNADKRVEQPPHLAGAAARVFTRARLSAFHRGVFLEMSVNISVQLKAMLPGTRPPRLLC
jgi:hypothetical protein